MSEAKAQKRFGFKRWIVLALVAAGAYAAFFGPSVLKPISPVVVLPGEPTGLHIGNFQITNTTLATLLADVVLLLAAFSAWRFSKSGNLVPAGFYNAFEALVEFLWNTVEQTVGAKWAKSMFKWLATIFLLIFVANMVKMVPGFESIGYLKEAHGHGYAPVALFHIGDTTIWTIDKGQPVEAAHDAHGEEAAAAAHGEDAAPCHACEVVPFLRGTATDLNFTLALAFLTVLITQIYGVMALGPSYFEKFFQIRQLISGGIFGAINFAVGLLEIILELAKILSFAFRLFGNIFAGALLLSIVGALTAVVVPAGLYLFEVFFGIIQAYVWFLLATVFFAGATVSHHGDDHGEH